MTEETLNEDAGKLTDGIKRAGENIADYSAETYKAASDRASDLLGCTTDAIRANPIPAVVGALALGIAIGSLIVSGRRSSFIDEDTFADAGDAISRSLSRLSDHLKFW